MQAVFNEVLGLHVLRDYPGQDAFVRIHRLSQERFPSWCTGPCGCSGASKVTLINFCFQFESQLAQEVHSSTSSRLDLHNFFRGKVLVETSFTGRYSLCVPWCYFQLIMCQQVQ